MRKVLAVTGYRSDYTKLKTVLKEIEACPDLELEIVSFGAHALGDYGNTINMVKEDNHTIVDNILTNVEGNTTFAMSKSIGLAIIELSSLLSRSKPDIVLLCADRYETMAAAIAVSVNNIPIAHIQGGEVSGTIDEILRHSITKLSHIHFPSTELSKDRIIQMGEHPDFVYNVGCPAIDYIKASTYLPLNEMGEDPYFGSLGLDFEKDYLILLQHPVTTLSEDFNETLEAVQEIGLQTLMIYPNPDAGGEGIVKDERRFSKKYGKGSVIVGKYKNIPFDKYLNLLKHSRALIGNSSSGIREAYAFNVPVINIGTRQQNRERSSNVVDARCNREAIVKAFNNYSNLSGEQDNLYGDGLASKRISKILTEVNLEKSLEKLFHIL